MIKKKLIIKRKEKGISQTEVATYIGVEQSQYCRREKGEIRITEQEWNKIAKFLNVPFSAIYEPHESLSIRSSNLETDSFILTLQRYIQKLEAENELLKEENYRLKNS